MPNAPTLATAQFFGIRNKSDSVGLAGFTAADNVIIDGAGVLAVRRGQTALNATAYRGAYATPDGKRGYAVTAAGALQDWSTDAAPVLASGFVGYPYWCQAADTVFVGNENQVWRIGADRSITANALPQPRPPLLTAVTGALPAGQYRFVQVTVSGGRESAPSSEAIITVNGSQNIQISGITGQRIYVCPADSKLYGWWRDTSAAALVYAGTTAEVLGEGLSTLNLQPMPLGRCLALQERRLHCAVYDARAKVSTLYRSLPGWWDLSDIVVDTKLVPGEIRAMAGLPGGLLIGTERQVFVLADNVLTKLADYGVPPGQAIAFDQSGATCWIWTQRGLRSALPFAEVTPQHAPPIADWVGTAVVREGGDTRFIVALSPFANPDNAFT